MGFVSPFAPPAPPPPLRDRFIGLPSVCFLEPDQARRQRLLAVGAFFACIDGDKEARDIARALAGGKKPGPKNGSETRATLNKIETFKALLVEIAPMEVSGWTDRRIAKRLNQKFRGVYGRSEEAIVKAIARARTWTRKQAAGCDNN
jgi:hypothetical protein